MLSYYHVVCVFISALIISFYSCSCNLQVLDLLLSLFTRSITHFIYAHIYYIVCMRAPLHQCAFLRSPGSHTHVFLTSPGGGNAAENPPKSTDHLGSDRFSPKSTQSRIVKHLQSLKKAIFIFWDYNGGLIWKTFASNRNASLGGLGYRIAQQRLLHRFYGAVEGLERCEKCPKGQYMPLGVHGYWWLKLWVRETLVKPELIVVNDG